MLYWPSREWTLCKSRGIVSRDAYSSMVPDPTSDISRGPYTSILRFVFPIGLVRLITVHYFCNFINGEVIKHMFLLSNKHFTSCKTNMLTILMHQMHISTTQVSSVMLRSTKLEIQKKNEKTERAVWWKPNTVPWNWAKSIEE
jgi:hypothetical protein